MGGSVWGLTPNLGLDPKPRIPSGTRSWPPHPTRPNPTPPDHTTLPASGGGWGGWVGLGWVGWGGVVRMVWKSW